MHTGFSIAILSQSAFANAMKNLTASSRCASRPGKRSLNSCLNHLFPVTARYVQGGCAIIKSHSPVCVCISGLKRTVAVQQRKHIFLYMPLRVTPRTLLDVTRKALCPFARKALQTSWLSSQAIKTFIKTPPYSV